MDKFCDQFIHASTGKKPKEEEKPIVMAALMAMGTNVGLVKIAEATPGITYYQMANSVEWRMYEDAFNKSQVKKEHYTDTAGYWDLDLPPGIETYQIQSSIHSPRHPIIER